MQCCRRTEELHVGKLSNYHFSNLFIILLLFTAQIICQKRNKTQFSHLRRRFPVNTQLMHGILYALHNALGRPGLADVYYMTGWRVAAAAVELEW